jgi:hypothetical protein
MTGAISDADLNEIERRLRKALEVAPQPWTEFLKTRHATGGGSFIRIGEDSELDHEMHVDIHLGDSRWSSPDVRLDAVIDLLGHAPEDIQRLLQEVRRLQAQQT